MRRPIAAVAALVCAAALGACTGSPNEDSVSEPAPAASSTSPTAATEPTESASEPSEPTEATSEPAPEPDWGPVSLPAIADKEIRGDRLRFTAARERTSAYVSREVSYRVRAGQRTLRITGVLNVPTGRAPAGGWPTVVLAHGYIDPAVYDTGQGMTRERGWLAERGYVALHVDYRDHAGSDDDPGNDWRTRLGYVEDVVAAADALRGSPDVPVDDDRVFLMGRSMGGGVALRTLVTKPGVFAGAVAWASVSSSEPENLARFIGDDPQDTPVLDEIERRVGLPGQAGSRKFWRGVSARTFFDQVEDPVLIVHGDSDDTCPPRWARDSHRLLRAAGADARIAWYADEHAFGPQFDAAMRRSVGFFESVRT